MNGVQHTCSKYVLFMNSLNIDSCNYYYSIIIQIYRYTDWVELNFVTNNRWCFAVINSYRSIFVPIALIVRNITHCHRLPSKFGDQIGDFENRIAVEQNGYREIIIIIRISKKGKRNIECIYKNATSSYNFFLFKDNDNWHGYGYICYSEYLFILYYFIYIQVRYITLYNKKNSNYNKYD